MAITVDLMSIGAGNKIVYDLLCPRATLREIISSSEITGIESMPDGTKLTIVPRETVESILQAVHVFNSVDQEDAVKTLLTRAGIAVMDPDAVILPEDWLCDEIIEDEIEEESYFMDEDGDTHPGLYIFKSGWDVTAYLGPFDTIEEARDAAVEHDAEEYDQIPEEDRE
jgi:hypothetical protein